MIDGAGGKFVTGFFLRAPLFFEGCHFFDFQIHTIN